MRQSCNSSARTDGLILVLLGLGSALCYAAALMRFPLLAIYAQPIQNLEKLTNDDPLTGLALTGWTLLVFASYAVGAMVLARGVRRNEGSGEGVKGPETSPPLTPYPIHRFTLLALLGFPLIFLALLACVYPTTSVDLYDYMFRGRMLAQYQANTFIQVPVEFNSDPLFWYVAWRKAVTAYGPLWEGMSWLTARLAGERPGRLLYGQEAQYQALLHLMLAYKGLSALGFLGCGAAIWFTLRRSAFAWRWLGMYLWLWNPLALWESLAAGHNDAWMAMLIVLAVGLLVPRRGAKQTRRVGEAVALSPDLPVSLSVCIAAFLVLTAGGLVKFLALMFGPLLLCAALRRTPDWRARLRLVLAGGLACVAAVVLAYAPFWAGWATLRNFGDRGALFTNSWLAALQAPITLSAVHALLPGRDLLAMVSFGPPSEAISQAIAVSIGLGLLVFGVLWASWRAWSAPEDVAAHALWLLLWFLFLCNPWFQPWYLLWALALLAIQPWRGRHMWAVGLFCVTAILSYLSGGFLLPLLGWKDSSAEWTILTSALIYGPPLLVLLPGWRLRRVHLPRQLRRGMNVREEEVVGG
ncbi:MAG: hypothetical protein ABIV47_05080 [Roseiflexaceae bacterium]